MRPFNNIGLALSTTASLGREEKKQLLRNLSLKTIKQNLSHKTWLKDWKNKRR